MSQGRFTGKPWRYKFDIRCFCWIVFLILKRFGALRGEALNERRS